MTFDKKWDAFYTGILLGVIGCYLIALVTPDPVRVVVVTQKVKITWSADRPEAQKIKPEITEEIP